jgi:hypothetical protein
MKSGDGFAMEVDKSDLHHTRIIALPECTLKEGQVRVSVDSFALTANNITYAVFGDAMKYWNFFPASSIGWGRVPVWGFGTIIESLSPELEEGERIYGYFPMASHIILEPERIHEDGFRDGVEHRDGLSAVYNSYSRIASDPGYRADYENQQMLFSPLFKTSFLIDDLLAEHSFYGAEQVILSSASSKTALALAWLLQKRGNIQTIALTSRRSRAFVRNSQIYSQAVLYEEITDHLPYKPAVFVDFAGNADHLRLVHETLGDELKASVQVGAADWSGPKSATSSEPLPGPKPAFFFAPSQGEKRVREWGPEDFERRVRTEMLEFYEPASRWIKTVRGIGGEAIQECYERALKGEITPSEGYILGFNV